MSADDVNRILHRQDDLGRRIDALQPSLLKQLAPALIGLLGVLAGAALANFTTIVLQSKRIRHERDSAKVAAGIAAASSINAFRSRQLYELYAPLEALLLQGVTVRNELYRMLIDSKRADRTYEMRNDPQGHNGQSLYVVPKDQAISANPFRLIEQMEYLQANHADIMGPINEIVAVNDRIVRLLHEKIGLVRNENTKLSKQLGRFLAHQGVLKAIASNDGRSRDIALPTYTTTFPRRLDKLVERDAQILRAEIKAWESLSAGWMKSLT